MEISMFNGKCPECDLNGNTEIMYRNFKDCFECPSCQLQIYPQDDLAYIFRFRGNSDFKLNFLKLKKELFFAEVSEDEELTGTIIISEEDLKEYLIKIPSPNEFSVDKLIDAYVDFKFGNQPVEAYQKQSEHFKIDFEDETIQQQLKQRDLEKQINPLYAHAGAYRFLQRILKKYYFEDPSWLPEMGMTKLEFYLSIKHFPHSENKKIQADPFFTKQRLKNLAVDLIEIVYHNQMPLLSYDADELNRIKREIYPMEKFKR